MNDIANVNDERLRDAYRQMVTRRGPSRRDCVTPEELLAIVEGSGSEEERLRVLRHVGSCARCHKELELLRLAAHVSHEVERPRRMATPVLALAAGFVVILGGVALWSRGSGGGEAVDVVRGSGAIELLLPRTDSAVTAPVTLVWTAVPDTPRYQVELLDPDGRPVYVVTTRDTAAAVPDSVRLRAGTEYRWWVRALKSDGSQPASTVRRLRIATP